MRKQTIVIEDDNTPSREREVIRLDEKHHLDIEVLFKETMWILKPMIVKTGNLVPIPDNEPRILFRGRDKLALKMLRYYRQLCVEDGCNEFQLASVDVMIGEFEEFARSTDTMKQPGVTKGK